jgi:putative ABC transport system permease protein
MQALAFMLVLKDFRTMQEQIDKNLMKERVVAFLTSRFGALSSLMAGIGIHGVLAYTRAQRTRELGMGIALGATKATVIGMVLEQSALACRLSLWPPNYLCRCVRTRSSQSIVW